MKINDYYRTVATSKELNKKEADCKEIARRKKNIEHDYRMIDTLYEISLKVKKLAIE